jgi:hypothetical protein
LSLAKDQKGYVCWQRMKQRCTRKSYPGWKNYGGKGIKYCAEWENFAAFIKDMGPRPDGMTLDRVDNDKDYCKSNCRWATWKEQANNRSNNRPITIGGVTKNLAQWASDAGFKRSIVGERLRRGKSIREALSLPIQRRKIISFEGHTRNLAEWSRHTGIPLTRISARLSRGWDIKRTLCTPIN